MKSYELIKFSKNIYKVECYMHDMNYKSDKLDTYLKHVDLQDRYTKLHQEQRQPNGHIPSRQPPSHILSYRFRK